MSEEAILKVSGLHVKLAGSHILQGVDFQVAPGRVTAMLGRNGVGKSTTLKAILNLVRQSEGSVEFEGESISNRLTHQIVRLGIGYVPEDREVFGALTVEENLRLAERKGSEPNYELVHTLFPELKQRRKQLAGALSGGQQQMVSLARVVLSPTKLLLIDEPTKGLAPRLVNEVGDLLVRIAEHTPILLVEQNLPLVKKIATDALVMDMGRIVFTGPAATLLNDDEATNRLLGVAGRSSR